MSCATIALSGGSRILKRGLCFEVHGEHAARIYNRGPGAEPLVGIRGVEALVRELTEI